MSWTAVKTFTSTTLTAADLNTYLSANTAYLKGLGGNIILQDRVYFDDPLGDGASNNYIDLATVDGVANTARWVVSALDMLRYNPSSKKWVVRADGGTDHQVATPDEIYIPIGYASLACTDAYAEALGTRVLVNASKFPYTTVGLYLELVLVSMSVGGSTFSARLYNVTTSAAIGNTEITSISTAGSLYRNGTAGALTAGENTYCIQMKRTSGADVTATFQARLVLKIA